MIERTLDLPPRIIICDVVLHDGWDRDTVDIFRFGLGGWDLDREALPKEVVAQIDGRVQMTIRNYAAGTLWDGGHSLYVGEWEVRSAAGRRYDDLGYWWPLAEAPITKYDGTPITDGNNAAIIRMHLETSEWERISP